MLHLSLQVVRYSLEGSGSFIDVHLSETRKSCCLKDVMTSLGNLTGLDSPICDS